MIIGTFSFLHISYLLVMNIFFISISKYNRSPSLSWNFHWNVDYFWVDPLLLVLMLVMDTATLFLSVGPAASETAWTAVFSSVAACMITCLTISAFSIFINICQSAYWRMSCMSLPCWDCFLLVCHTETISLFLLVCLCETFHFLLTPCDVTCLNDDNTNGHSMMHITFIFPCLYCLVYLWYMKLYIYTLLR